MNYLPYDPHSVLGLHPYNDTSKVIRLLRHGTASVHLEVLGSIVEAKQLPNTPFFEYIVPLNTTLFDYRIYHSSGLLANDPYSFVPTFGETDQYLFSKGVHYDLYKKMGGRLINHQGVEGASFAVWAPNAKAVSVIGDFNNWDGRLNPMRSLGYSGVWEIFIPGLTEDYRYKFEIFTEQGQRLIKSDPYALYSELRPANASKLANPFNYVWHDQSWIKKRKETKDFPKPINIYEVHLGSWKRPYGHFINYKEAAHELAAYCREMGYTHIELMPIQEHPLDESWGYQVTGFYSPTSRFGTVHDFLYFVDYLHQNDIGVILDWVPGHFPIDEFSLVRFDGSALYEHNDPRQGFHPHWYTHIFNFGRNEVSIFLIANALYWIEAMHIDGLRVDAVASLLYLDYGREAGEWIPNIYGGKENLQSIEFLKHLNSIVHERCPGALTIAEESTSFTGVTHPLAYNGLGFDMKWNMGWMNDTLRYFSKDSVYRKHHHHDLTFGLIYAFSEKFALVLSHDEVVHGKRSLLSKMPGDYWQRFANLRLLISYMICQPGKKLLFMGGEIGQWNEWYCNGSIEWDLLHYPIHHGLQTMVKDINYFYLRHPSLWERDFNYKTFEWVDFNDVDNSVISYLRRSDRETLLCIHNFTPNYVHDYYINIDGVDNISEVFNSDAEKYGGSGKVNNNPYIVKNGADYPVGLKIELSPLATMIFSLSKRS